MSHHVGHWFPLPQRPIFPMAVMGEGLLPDEVDRIESLWAGARKYRAEVSGDIGYVEELRKSTLVPLRAGDEHRWLFERVSEIGRQINAENYGFELLGICEPLQLAEYNVGDLFEWHMDYGGGGTSCRKLSVTVQLSAPDAYEGGTLEFMSNDRVAAPRDRGAVIIFPSFMLHRVTPVTRGRRASLVAWLSGIPFR